MRVVGVLCGVLLTLLSSIALGNPLSRGPFGCDQGKRCPAPQWQKIEADNGTVYYVDTATITPSNMIAGGQVILIYRDDGSEPDFGNTGWFAFYCDRPLVLPHGIGEQPEYVPPRSVFGTIREIACGRSTPQAKNQEEGRLSDDTSNIAQAIREMKEALKDPEKVRALECMGIKIYKDPQPPGHPPNPEECKAIFANHGMTGNTGVR